MSDKPDKQMSSEERDRYLIDHAGGTSQERFYTQAEVKRLLEAKDDERKSQIDASVAVEREDCKRALLALAGWFPTPAETYGCNTSWAISDLIRGIAAKDAEIERVIATNEVARKSENALRAEVAALKALFQRIVDRLRGHV